MSDELHEALPSPLRIDLLEPFVLVSLLDHTQSSKEETEYDCHITIDGCEDIVEGHIREVGDGLNAEVGGDVWVEIEIVNKVLAGAEVAYFRKVGGVKVAAAFEHVLEAFARLRCSCDPQCMEIVSLLEGKKPNKAANDDNTDSVNYEHIVGDDQANSDMVALDNAGDGYSKGDNERNTQNGTSGEVSCREDQVHQQVLSPPYKGEGKRDSARCKQQEVQNGPDTHQLSGNHLAWLLDRKPGRESGEGGGCDGLLSSREE